MIKRVILPVVVSSLIILKPHIAIANSKPKQENFPKYFFDGISELNSKDSKIAFDEMKENLLEHYPNKYKYIVDNIHNHDVIFELDYIRIMYKKPLSHDRKIILRNNIFKLLKNNNFSEKELELFEYLLKYYECID